MSATYISRILKASKYMKIKEIYKSNKRYYESYIFQSALKIKIMGSVCGIMHM
jgi:hypothetical protein